MAAVTMLLLLATAPPFLRPARAQAAGAIQLNARPLLDLGGDMALKGPPLQKVVAATRVQDKLAIYDEGAGTLLFYDARGRFVREIRSSSGSGPGAFTRITWMGQCTRGLLFILDPVQRRVTVFGPSGIFVRRFRLPPFAMKWTCSVTGALATLLTPHLKPYRLWTRERGVAPIQIMDAAGNVTRETAPVAVGEGLIGGRLTSIAMANRRLYVGTADSAFVDVFDLEAKLVKSVALGKLQPRLMTRRDYEVIVSRRLPNWPDSILRQALQAPMPKYHPLYRHLRATPEGTLWLVVSAESDDTTRIRVVSASGRFLSEMRFPGAGNVLDVGEDFVIAEYRSPNGVEHVVMYAVRMRP